MKLSLSSTVNTDLIFIVTTTILILLLDTSYSSQHFIAVISTIVNSMMILKIDTREIKKYEYVCNLIILFLVFHAIIEISYTIDHSHRLMEMTVATQHDMLIIREAFLPMLLRWLVDIICRKSDYSQHVTKTT